MPISSSRRACYRDEIDPRTIRLRTFSKAYGLAGARVGYAIAAPETIATFARVRQHFGVNRTGQIGALAALADTTFVPTVVAQVARGRAEYAELGQRLGCRTLPSATNFVCFEIGSRPAADAMVARLLELGVFVRKPYAPPLDGFIRVTVGTAAERAAFAAVAAEARHHDIVWLSVAEEVDERIFPDWDMEQVDAQDIRSVLEDALSDAEDPDSRVALNRILDGLGVGPLSSLGA